MSGVRSFPRHPAPMSASTCSLPGLSQTIRNRFQIFWARVGPGLELEQLWDQFLSEARGSYGLCTPDVDSRALAVSASPARAFPR